MYIQQKKSLMFEDAHFEIVMQDYTITKLSLLNILALKNVKLFFPLSLEERLNCYF